MISREEIIKEIQRTAVENGGTPLGRGRFEKITGIKPWDWGKYWARFGDAQTEAGYTPNTLMNAYGENNLFDKYIELCRKLKKLPAYGDLRVKHSDDPSFPTANTFGRLGSKRVFLSKLKKYAESKGYTDVVTLSNAALENEKTEELDKDSFHDVTIGSVYLLKSGRFYKIGRTNSMGRRHHEITILLPDGAELVHEIKTDDPSGIEAYWHRRFEDKRKNGEWFDLRASDVRAFKRWRKIV